MSHSLRCAGELAFRSPLSAPSELHRHRPCCLLLLCPPAHSRCVHPASAHATVPRAVSQRLRRAGAALTAIGASSR